MVAKDKNSSTGALGEAIAAQFLMERGHSVVAMNYRTPLSEIDVITKHNETVHFVEVKTLSYKSKADLVGSAEWQPEKQVHERKLQQIRKSIEYWLHEHSYTGNVQVDVIAVKIVPRETYASVNYIENVIIGWDATG